jgi:hypothetical protein
VCAAADDLIWGSADGRRKEYLVAWEIELGAYSPREAAEHARAIVRRPGTHATLFSVTDVASRQTYAIDLDDD